MRRVSLYSLQKAIYDANREPVALARYRHDARAFASDYELSAEEAAALCAPDIGLLYVLGVNGQLLMHFAAACGYPWDSYLAAMRQGLETYGPVRGGLYAARGTRK